MLTLVGAITAWAAPQCWGEYKALRKAEVDVGVLNKFVDLRRLQDDVDANTDLRTAKEAAAAMREHVRFVAAFRKDQVDKILGEYDSLVQYWPCIQSPAIPECRPPSEAARLALSNRWAP